MEIWVKPYRKINGELMFYLNNDRGVSLGISEDRGYQSSKASQGQKKLWSAFCQATREAAPIATGADMQKHNEEFLTMFNDVSFAVTDIAQIGGVSTGSDGLFVVRDGNVFKPRFNQQTA